MEEEITLPSQHQVGDRVWLNFWSCSVPAGVIAVHFYPGKVKYDLEVNPKRGNSTRMYNIDSLMVTKTKD